MDFLRFPCRGFFKILSYHIPKCWKNPNIFEIWCDKILKKPRHGNPKKSLVFELDFAKTKMDLTSRVLNIFCCNFQLSHRTIFLSLETSNPGKFGHLHFCRYSTYVLLLNNIPKDLFSQLEPFLLEQEVQPFVPMVRINIQPEFS